MRVQTKQISAIFSPDEFFLKLTISIFLSNFEIVGEDHERKIGVVWGPGRSPGKMFRIHIE